MRVLSLFDGISCGRLALQRAGIPVEKYYASEIDKNAIKITQKNFPDTVQLGDVTKIDFRKFAGEIDLLIGGSPCQSLSITQSKTRQNLDGKSKLFFEFVRALEEVRPTYFLLENVASMKQGCKQVISEYMGRDPIFINSSKFAAQERERYYWTNIPVSVDLPDSDAVLGDILQPETEIPERLYYSAPITGIDMSRQVCATLEIKNHEMHRRVFSPAHKMHALTCVSGGHQQKKVLINGRVRKLTPIEYERLQTLPDDYTAGVSDTARYTAIGNGWTVDVVAHIFSFLKKKTWMRWRWRSEFVCGFFGDSGV